MEASDRFRLFDEVTSAVLAESLVQPLLVVFDDLQWADPPTLALLDFALRRLPVGSVALLGAYRDVDRSPVPGLASFAARVPVLRLIGLARPAVAGMLTDILGSVPAPEVAAPVHQRIGGNPFFVEQVSWLLRTGEAGMPAGVDDALARRFDALPPATAAALAGAGRAGGCWSRSPGCWSRSPGCWPGTAGNDHALGRCPPRPSPRRGSPLCCSPDLPNHFRKPYGPGWALVGDAGLVLDPITGLGISDALRDAELLADALADGGSDALAGYQKARDRAARPMYDFTVRLAGMRPITPAELRMFRALADSQTDADTFVGVLTGGVPLRTFMSPGYLIHLVGVGGFVKLALSSR